MTRQSEETTPEPVVLITGGARRLGAEAVRLLHAAGWRVVLHYRHSGAAAHDLAAQLNAARADSVRLLQADLGLSGAAEQLAAAASEAWGRLDALINNASTWFATPLASLDEAAFDTLIGANLKAPLFLAKACAPRLVEGGVIVNVLDVHARRPYAGFSAYLAAKAALWTVTEALALELAPRIRVNAVAPGHMLWEEGEGVLSAEQRVQEEARIPLGRLGGAREVAHCLRFLLSPEAAYLTGAILPVDGGLRLA